MLSKVYEQINRSMIDQDVKDLKVCVMGIGSDLRGDDAAGLIIADTVSRKSPAGLKDKIHVIYASTAPENFTGEIKKVSPSHLFIVDCADLGMNPGDISIVEEDKISGVSFSTHTLPISIIVDYLKKDIDFKTLIIGIQPFNTDFGSEVSNQVTSACDIVSSAIIRVLEDKCSNR